jgi:threonine dehydrogenase-like Zn-dependent dehydrogenase
MLRWHLYDAGFENLGRNGGPEEVEMPAFGADELLVRQDACGLCFSDTKVIQLGPDHPRLNGRNLGIEPVTLGHEVACTVVAVGENLIGRFAVGERYVVQADVFYHGKSVTYGYAIPGGLAEYSVIPQAVIDGDEGCYLLPVAPDTGYVEAALTEPWACVVAAYTLSHRAGILAGGEMLVIAGEGAGRQEYDWTGLFSRQRKPNHVIAYGFEDNDKGPLLALLQKYRIPFMFAAPEDWNKVTGSGGFDDVLILGSIDVNSLETVAGCLNDNAIFNLVGDWRSPRKAALDIGRIHYNRHHYVGTPTLRPADGYLEKRGAELLDGGLVWFIGAGGPMGQMHVQRAVHLPEPPRRIVVTDLDADRLACLMDRFGTVARERGIEMIAVNPTELGAADYLNALEQLSDGCGFDDIVTLAPSAAVTEQAADFLAPGGRFNIFAGVARGIRAELNLDRIVRNRCRFVGSSGSSLADMKNTLSRVERGELSTNESVAAIGGMDAAAEGLRAVKEGRFPGKTVIFPQIRSLPLIRLSDLKNSLPTVHSRLKAGLFWTSDAEAELLRLKLTQL